MSALAPVKAGTSRRCRRCGVPVRPRSNSGLCYECATGREIEQHHPWNKASFPAMAGTVPMPGNIHRDLSKLWGERCDALKHPGDDPLNRMAAALSTIGEAAQAAASQAADNSGSRRGDSLAWLVELFPPFARCIKSVVHWLLCLAAALAKRFGENWAEQLGMPLWCPPEPRDAK